MSRNHINIEGEDRGFAKVRFGRTMVAVLSTLVIGGALVLAQGNGVEAASGTAVKVAMAETVAPAPLAPQATIAPAQPRKQIRVIPLYNIPADQAGEKR